MYMVVKNVWNCNRLCNDVGVLSRPVDLDKLMKFYAILHMYVCKSFSTVSYRKC